MGVHKEEIQKLRQARSRPGEKETLIIMKKIPSNYTCTQKTTKILQNYTGNYTRTQQTPTMPPKHIFNNSKLDLMTTNVLVICFGLFLAIVW